MIAFRIPYQAFGGNVIRGVVISVGITYYKILLRRVENVRGGNSYEFYARVHNANDKCKFKF